MPLEPMPLRPEANTTRTGAWLRERPAGLVTIALGALAFIVATLQPQPLWSVPDWRITVPFFIATLITATISFVRKEGTPGIPLLGVGLAAATLVLGWFFITAAVIAVTTLLILILSMVM